MSEGGGPPEEKPLPVSMWTDKKLRPWTIDEKLDEDINDANERLNIMVNKTSGSKIAGTLGQSSIDKKPDAFLDFERIIQDKNWIYKLGSDAEDEERDKILAELAQHIADGEDFEAQSPETELGSPNINLAITGQHHEDKAFLNSILDFNAALYADEASNKETANDRRPATATVLPSEFTELADSTIRLARKPRKKKRNPAYSLKSIKYKPRVSPAILNVSTNEFQRLLSRFNLKNKRGNHQALTMGSDGRSTYASVNEESYNDTSSQSNPAFSLDMSQMAAPSNQGNETAYTMEAMKEKLNTLDKDQLIALLLEERTATPVASARGSARGGSGGSARGKTMSEDDYRPMSAPVSARSTTGRPGSSTAAEASSVEDATGGLQAVPEDGILIETESEEIAHEDAILGAPNVAISPIRTSRQGSRQGSRQWSRPTSRSGNDLLLNTSSSVPNLDSVQLTTQPSSSSMQIEPDALLNAKGPDSPSSKAPSPSKGGQNNGPGMRLSQSTSSLPTQKQQLKAAKKGSNNASDQRAKKAGKTAALDKLGVGTVGGMGNTMSLSKKRVKEIRSLRDYMMTTSGAFAMNVNPDASPDAQAEVADSIAVTKDMVKETVRKNRVDQTWTLINTPGFYEAVGPEQIFKSDAHLGFTRNDKFDKAVRDANVDLGIKRDDLRVWSENGVKSKIKLFQSGGAFRI